MLDAMLRLTKKRFNNTILMQLEVDEPASLTSIGVDNMFAAEARTCLQYIQG